MFGTTARGINERFGDAEPEAVGVEVGAGEGVATGVEGVAVGDAVGGVGDGVGDAVVGDGDGGGPSHSSPESSKFPKVTAQREPARPIPATTHIDRSMFSRCP